MSTDGIEGTFSDALSDTPGLVLDEFTQRDLVMSMLSNANPSDEFYNWITDPSTSNPDTPSLENIYEPLLGATGELPSSIRKRSHDTMHNGTVLGDVIVLDDYVQQNGKSSNNNNNNNTRIQLMLPGAIPLGPVPQRELGTITITTPTFSSPPTTPSSSSSTSSSSLSSSSAPSSPSVYFQPPIHPSLAAPTNAPRSLAQATTMQSGTSSPYSPGAPTNTFPSLPTSPQQQFQQLHQQFQKQIQHQQQQHLQQPLHQYESGGYEAKKHKTAEDREQIRAEQQRNASRRYRQKKKTLVEQLEAKLKEISDEKERIEREHRDAMDYIQKLKSENSDLRRVHHLKSEKIKEARRPLLEQLQDLVQRDAEDELIRPVVSQLAEICVQISALGECQSKMLICPPVVGQLVKSGFFDTPAAAVGNETDPHGIAHFAQKVLTSLQGTITEEQTGKIQQLVAEFYDDIAELREERIQLNRDIVQFFSGQGVSHPNFEPAMQMFQSIPSSSFSAAFADVTTIPELEFEQGIDNALARKMESTPGSAITDVTRTIQALSTLEYLRKNISEEVHRSEAYLAKILMVLTTKQQARFFLQVEFYHRSVVKLKQMWEAMQQSVLRTTPPHTAAAPNNTSIVPSFVMSGSGNYSGFGSGNNSIGTHRKVIQQ